MQKISKPSSTYCGKTRNSPLNRLTGKKEFANPDRKFALLSTRHILKIDPHLSLEGAGAIFRCNDPERGAAVDIEIRQPRARMVQHIRGIHAELETLDPSRFADLERLGEVRVEAPCSGEFDGFLAEGASRSRLRILQDNRSRGTIRVAYPNSTQRAGSPKIVGGCDTGALRIGVFNKRVRIIEVASVGSIPPDLSPRVGGQGTDDIRNAASVESRWKRNV